MICLGAGPFCLKMLTRAYVSDNTRPCREDVGDKYIMLEGSGSVTAMPDIFDIDCRKIAAMREFSADSPDRPGFCRKNAALREIFGRKGSLKAALPKNCSIA